MTAATESIRRAKAKEHLCLMRALSQELERAMTAVALNDLPQLEESIANQQELSSRLTLVANELSLSTSAGEAIAEDAIDPKMILEIRAANGELQKLNLRYSILLKHASRSVELMAAMFSGLRGQLQEASGPRLKHQTWSCRM